MVNSVRLGKSAFSWGKRTYVMGIINVSPDSFSGDGLQAAEHAVAQAQRFAAEGADMLDIGGESTRPGYKPVALDEEIRRVIPSIEQIVSKVAIPLSVDTMKYEVARRALEAGAGILNDQWGLKKEPRLAELAGLNDAYLIVMSNQRDQGGYDPGVGRDTAAYTDVMAEVNTALQRSIETAHRAGVKDDKIIIDPGIGFGKTWQQDIEIIRRLTELRPLGKPILVGTSRKSLIKMVLNLPAEDRIEGTAATIAVAIANGADIVRVHDVKQMTRICKMTDAIVRGI